MVDIRRVKLPGVGLLHTFYTDDGGKVGVIAHRSGHSDLIVLPDSDGGEKAIKVGMRLTEDEARTLAELLGGTQITEDHAALEDLPGLSIDWFPVEAEHHISGQPLGNPATWGLVGVTVVAIVRGDSANPAPASDFIVSTGDTLVVAGSPEKVARLFAFYRTGETVARPKSAPVDAPPGL